MIKKQVERKMKRKELKALRAAKIEETLKQALLERLSTVCFYLSFSSNPCFQTSIKKKEFSISIKKRSKRL